jgi:hypothetical protein
MLISFAPTHVNMIATPVKLDYIDSVAGCDPLESFGVGNVLTAVQRLQTIRAARRLHTDLHKPVVGHDDKRRAEWRKCVARRPAVTSHRLVLRR